MATVVKPNGKLRICIDPRDINKAIKREYYPIRTVEEIVTRAKVLSVLDASYGFWQVKLVCESAIVCTFNTLFGRYMFTQFPFGISSAQDVFQVIMSEMFEDIEGVEGIVDDLLIWAETAEEHDKRLEKGDTAKPGLWTLDWTVDWTMDWTSGDHYQLCCYLK